MPAPSSRRRRGGVHDALCVHRVDVRAEAAGATSGPPRISGSAFYGGTATRTPVARCPVDSACGFSAAQMRGASDGAQALERQPRAWTPGARPGHRARQHHAADGARRVGQGRSRSGIRVHPLAEAETMSSTAAPGRSPPPRSSLRTPVLPTSSRLRSAPTPLRGLSEDEAAARLADDGPNVTAPVKRPRIRPSRSATVRETRSSHCWWPRPSCRPASGSGSRVLSSRRSCVLNAVLGFAQEASAERALLALSRIRELSANVIREGNGASASRLRSSFRATSSSSAKEIACLPMLASSTPSGWRWTSRF